MTTYMRTVIIAGLVALAGIVPASAQTAKVTATVPFEFTIGDVPVPRGVYDVSRVDWHTDVLLVRSARQAIFIVGRSGESEDRNAPPQLVFHRYGNQYFLREIQFLNNLGVSLPETRDEREAAKQRADGAGTNVEAVVILAQRE